MEWSKTQRGCNLDTSFCVIYKYILHVAHVALGYLSSSMSIMSKILLKIIMCLTFSLMGRIFFVLPRQMIQKSILKSLRRPYRDDITNRWELYFLWDKLWCHNTHLFVNKGQSCSWVLHGTRLHSAGRRLLFSVFVIRLWLLIFLVDTTTALCEHQPKSRRPGLQEWKTHFLTLCPMFVRLVPDLSNFMMCFCRGNFSLPWDPHGNSFPPWLIQFLFQFFIITIVLRNMSKRTLLGSMRANSLVDHPLDPFRSTRGFGLAEAFIAYNAFCSFESFIFGGLFFPPLFFVSLLPPKPTRWLGVYFPTSSVFSGPGGG